VSALQPYRFAATTNSDPRTYFPAREPNPTSACSYPGAACDIPFSVYSFSVSLDHRAYPSIADRPSLGQFAPPVEHGVGTQWAGQPEIMSYL
jgi:hypothetical protein